MSSFMDEVINNLGEDLKVGDKVRGTVERILNDFTILLDVHSFTEGTMHLDHFTKDKNATSFKDLVKVGDIIECEVAKVSYEPNALILLSRLDELKEEAFNELKVAQENHTPVEATVSKDANGKGYILNYKGIACFMPKSQSPRDIKLKSNINVLVIDIDDDRKRAVVSAKEIAIQEQLKKKEAILEGINVGDTLKGVVTKVENYAAFVKCGEVSGMIKAKDVAHEFVDVQKVLKVGDELEVKVLSKDNGKLLFSRKALIDSPFTAFAKEHHIGDKVKGKVSNKLAFGLLLELAPNLKGLLHRSEYSYNPNDNLAARVIIGDELEVAILSMDEDGEKINLSIKALMDNPWDRVEAQVGDVVKAKVLGTNKGGVEVATDLGVDGFIPKSEALSYDDRNKDVSSFFAKDDEVEAKIIEIDPKQWRMVLSIRKINEDKERAELEKYNDNEEVSTNLGDKLKK